MALSDILAALRWWAVLALFGAAAWPLLYTLLHRLPDRGYAFARMAGLLLVSYVFWLTGSLGFTANHVGGILLALGVVAAASVWVYRRTQPTDEPIRAWMSRNRATIIAAELLFVAIFGLWVWVRAQNPAISATEKPMEFAFLNGVGRSAVFPPIDPWLSGYSISYYYFGYVMVSVLGRLALVTEPVAFNLAIAWLVAGTALGAFGIVYNLVALRGARQAAVGWGLAAALALSVAGNLQIGLELLHGNGIGSPGFWSWLDVRDINTLAEAEDPARYETSNWWWWRTSRVIREYHLSGRPEDGLEPIVEIPAFSFVLGDLHPHVLALPFAFLSLAAALTWWLAAGDPPTQQSTGRPGRLRRLSGDIDWRLWLFTVLVLGGLSFLNTWDVLIHLFVVLGAFLLGGARISGWNRALLSRTAWMALMLVLPAILLYLPFYLGFRSQAGPPFLLPMLMRPTRLAQYLIIFGAPLLPITVLLGGLALRSRFRHWKTGLAAAAGLLLGLSLLLVFLAWVLAAGAGSGTISNTAAELGITLAPRPPTALAPGWGLGAVAAILPGLLAGRLAYPALVLFLAALLMLTVMALRGQTEGAEATPARNDAGDAHPGLPFALLLILTGILLTLGPEFVYLKDNFGYRLNTTFKFYYQAWVMFGTAAVFALSYLWAAWRVGARRVAPALATGAYALLLIVALLFPYYAVRSRAAEYRGRAFDTAGVPQARQPATLNGLAHIERYDPAEYAALLWLREQSTSKSELPVVLEAVGGQYSEYARVSASTGLPTLVGWPGHEWQWRGSDHPEPGRREQIVRDIYSSTDLSQVRPLLDEFGVDLIYVGDLELSTYGPAGLRKFEQQLEVAYQNEQVTIYRWQSASGSGS